MKLPPRSGELIAGALRAYSRALLHMEKVVLGFAEEALPVLLDAEGERRFRNAVWKRTDVAAPGAQLMGWEEVWFQADLPPPPARVLVGAAGRGREVRWLVERGYDVTAFEPVAAFLDDLRRAGCSLVECASVEEIAAGGGRTLRSAAPFDAYLMTWGGLSLVRGREAHRAALAIGRELVPEGPLLLSYLHAGRGQGRARALGRSVARRLGLSGREEGDQLYPHLGIVHAFEEDELRLLATQTGSQLLRPPAGVLDYPHVTLVPRSPSRGEQRS